MSVLIKGMEMPEHCGYCRFRYDGICHALQKTQYSMEECPLVPVPKHGRLIDADVLDTSILQAIFSCAITRRKLRYTAGEVRQKIANAPTVIPASGEGE